MRVGKDLFLPCSVLFVVIIVYIVDVLPSNHAIRGSFLKFLSDGIYANFTGGRTNFDGIHVVEDSTVQGESLPGLTEARVQMSTLLLQIQQDVIAATQAHAVGSGGQEWLHVENARSRLGAAERINSQWGLGYNLPNIPQHLTAAPAGGQVVLSSRPSESKKEEEGGVGGGGGATKATPPLLPTWLPRKEKKMDRARRERIQQKTEERKTEEMSSPSSTSFPPPPSPPPFPPLAPLALTEAEKAEMFRAQERVPIDLPMVKVDEPPGIKNCSSSDCHGRGVCDRSTGWCTCQSGWLGDDCEVRDAYPCNTPEGNPISVRCAGHCDEDNNKCWCGPNSTYPERSMYKCYYANISQVMPWKDEMWDNWIRGESTEAFWGGPRSWCNMDPQLMERGQKPETHCLCNEGWAGPLCNIRTESYCLNHCSNRGTCKLGFCHCQEGFYGSDCSLVSRAEPHIVERKRPLIYVYELPGEFNTNMLAQREKKEKCAVRYYNEKGNTLWEANLYGAEPVFHERMLASPHRTHNPDQADYFFVPFYGACYMSRFMGSTPRHKILPHSNSPLQVAEQYTRVWEWISSRHPFWNRKGGADHLWMFFHDEGACFAPHQIWASTMITHWGRITPTKLPNSTHTFAMHAFNNIQMSERMDKIGDHACYDPSKDIVVPSFQAPRKIATSPFLKKDAAKKSPPTGAQPPLLFFFRGDIRMDRAQYSLGIRQQLAVTLAGLESEGVVMSEGHSPTYLDDLARATFCGVFPGNGWSGRLEDSILHGCIPVIIQDDIHVPLETFLNLSSVSIRYPRSEVHNLVEYLRAIPQERVQEMKKQISIMWPRFVYTSYFEAEVVWRRKRRFPPDELLESIVKATGGRDDAFETVMKELLYRKERELFQKSETFGV